MTLHERIRCRKCKCFTDPSFLGRLPLNVENAFHAVAMHNSGELYKSILFEPNHRTNLKQVRAVEADT